MHCYECGDTFKEKSGLLEVTDPYVGTIAIQGVPYYKCDKCDVLLYTEEMSRAIETERTKIINELLSQFPIGDFISAAETASMLGISRQALHKNRRVNHGLIYQTSFHGFTVYLRQSALQFKKTGDGRFPLYLYGYSPSAQYLEETIPMQFAPSYDLHKKISLPKRPQFQEAYVSLTENYYAN